MRIAPLKIKTNKQLSKSFTIIESEFQYFLHVG